MFDTNRPDHFTGVTYKMLGTTEPTIFCRCCDRDVTITEVDADDLSVADDNTVLCLGCRTGETMRACRECDRPISQAEIERDHIWTKSDTIVCRGCCNRLDTDAQIADAAYKMSPAYEAAKMVTIQKMRAHDEYVARTFAPGAIFND